MTEPHGRDWLESELAYWMGSNAASLFRALEPEIEAALLRMLPPQLSEAEAIAWANGLVASMHGPSGD